MPTGSARVMANTDGSRDVTIDREAMKMMIPINVGIGYGGVTQRVRFAAAFPGFEKLIVRARRLLISRRAAIFSNTDAYVLFGLDHTISTARLR